MSFLSLQAQNPGKKYDAVRAVTAPKIDGIIGEDEWRQAPVISDFVQYLPDEGKPPSQRSEIRIMYDDYGLYVAAMLFDTASDSIEHQLGQRDDAAIHSDLFRVGIDPYNKQQDAYIFEVYASGVQIDSRVLDPLYNGVWQSAARISDSGWSVEICVPYSAIRFPSLSMQDWGLQFARTIVRRNEYQQWALVPKDVSNGLIWWGHLKNIANIKAPLRLSLTPFASFYYEHSPQDNNGNITYNNAWGYGFGADLKYGIDEKFTLDITLLPDFSQVQSDNKVKNIGYEEVVYDENRPFFQEGTDLFTHDNLFYTRRIGRIPMGFEILSSQLNPGDMIRENPSKTRLINAVKLSGRNNKGLGMGLFNAITDNMFAVVEDSLGQRRKVLTEPLTNYNILILDQQLKYSSSIYLINTNVIRDKYYSDANVTGTGFTFCNKKQSYATDGSFSLSQKFSNDNPTDNDIKDLIGFKYFIGFRKISGKFQWGISHKWINRNYDSRDLGYFQVNNKMTNRLYWMYNIYRPAKTFRQMFNTLLMDYNLNPVTGKRTVGTQISFDNYTEWLNYWSLNAGASVSPFSFYDYDEPRVPGRYSRTFRYFYIYAGCNTDSRKALAAGLMLTLGNFIDRFKSENYIANLVLRYRVNDRLTFKYDFNYNTDPYNFGFANMTDSGDIIYGLRRMLTLSQSLSSIYIFKNDMSLTLNVRHYWNICRYTDYYTLLENGEIDYNPYYQTNNDFNYNVFNVDLIYSWQFSPGSMLNIVYKDAIENQKSSLEYNYIKDVKSTIDSPQINSISVKVLYYLDYQYIKKHKRKQSISQDKYPVKIMRRETKELNGL